MLISISCESLAVLKKVFCLRLFVVVITMYFYHGESVYQVSLLEDHPEIIYRHKHHLQLLLPRAVCCCLQACNFDQLSSWYISVVD